MSKENINLTKDSLFYEGQFTKERTSEILNYWNEIRPL